VRSLVGLSIEGEHKAVGSNKGSIWQILREK